MGTKQASDLTGISISFINLLVREGVIKPAVMAQGRGGSHEFSAQNIKQLIAYRHIRRMFGDGLAAQSACRQLLPRITEDTKSFPLSFEQEYVLL